MIHGRGGGVGPRGRSLNFGSENAEFTSLWQPDIPIIGNQQKELPRMLATNFFQMIHLVSQRFIIRGDLLVESGLGQLIRSESRQKYK